jgi:hypothetical protein
MLLEYRTVEDVGKNDRFHWLTSPLEELIASIESAIRLHVAQADPGDWTREHAARLEERLSNVQRLVHDWSVKPDEAAASVLRSLIRLQSAWTKHSPALRALEPDGISLLSAAASAERKSLATLRGSLGQQYSLTQWGPARQLRSHGWFASSAAAIENAVAMSQTTSAIFRVAKASGEAFAEVAAGKVEYAHDGQPASSRQGR